MRASFNGTVGRPSLHLKDDASGLTLSIEPPRAVMSEMVRSNAQWLYHNGTDEERADLFVLAREILDVPSPFEQAIAAVFTVSVDAQHIGTRLNGEVLPEIARTVARFIIRAFPGQLLEVHYTRARAAAARLNDLLAESNLWFEDTATIPPELSELLTRAASSAT